MRGGWCWSGRFGGSRRPGSHKAGETSIALGADRANDIRSCAKREASVGAGLGAKAGGICIGARNVFFVPKMVSLCYRGGVGHATRVAGGRGRRRLDGRGGW